MKVLIKKSTKPDKKYMALFCDCECNGKKNDCGKSKRPKTIHFGSAGMSDFTKNKDEKRKSLYIARHKAREDWTNPKTAGALSRWILWNKPTFKASVADYKKRFNLK
jgi:hypothetical protein|tara:strand:- start:6009 stop:6329 length:321 start_codon:yes stop_codon:yes gene_type:complete